MIPRWSKRFDNSGWNYRENELEFEKKIRILSLDIEIKSSVLLFSI